MRLSPLAIIPLFLLPACKMPESHIRDNNNNNGLFTKLEDPEDDNLDESKEIIAPDAPYLERLPNIYYFDTIPIHGTANPDTDVLVKSPKGVVAGRVGKDGTFCVDLPLALNQTQDIQVRVHNGLFSDFTTTTITQQYFGEDPEKSTADNTDEEGTAQPLFRLENIALDADVYLDNDVDLDIGRLDFLTDGITVNENADNHVDLIDSWFGGSAIFWIDLGDVHKLYETNLVFNTDNPDGLPGEVTVFTTTARDPGSPAKDNWDIDENTSAVQGYTTTVLPLTRIPLYNLPEARFVGFEVNFINNALSDKIVSLSEVRVMELLPVEEDDDDDTDDSPVEGLVTPSCANGLKI